MDPFSSLTPCTKHWRSCDDMLGIQCNVIGEESVWKALNAFLMPRYFRPKEIWAEPPADPSHFCVWKKLNANLRLSYCCPNEIWAEPPAYPSESLEMAKYRSEAKAYFYILPKINLGRAFGRPFCFAI